jgi:hypothetical protein
MLSEFFTLKIPNSLNQAPFKMRYLMLYYQTGIALLEEFQSFLWDHETIARKFLQTAIPG